MQHWYTLHLHLHRAFETQLSLIHSVMYYAPYYSPSLPSSSRSFAVHIKPLHHPSTSPPPSLPLSTVFFNPTNRVPYRPTDVNVSRLHEHTYSRWSGCHHLVTSRLVPNSFFAAIVCRNLDARVRHAFGHPLTQSPDAHSGRSRSLP